ncbi:MAG TPA: glycosyltransferase family 2 protein [Acidimicrobiales bacterium]|nr:glycosyltransferase family 2 protein [Acidimicrobiales bacterium]
MQLTYVLPLRSSEVEHDLAPYLAGLTPHVEVIAVDGSEDDVFDEHRRLFERVGACHVAVDPSRATLMGKVGGVMTGVAAASNEHVVIGDDDVRYTLDQLRRVDDLLREFDVVRPQNYFDPLPWHAKWDTGRILLNRMTGGDWPGTMGVRRSVLLRAGGYAGDVLFENLELVRTIEAVGGRATVDLGLLVHRIPPPTAQFLDQRVRQAYDEFARPMRLAFFLGILPFVAVFRGRGAAALAVATVGVAEAGRRRAGGREVFASTAALWAPVWLAERSVTSWLAVWSRVRHGGIRYRGTVLRRAANRRPTVQMSR